MIRKDLKLDDPTKSDLFLGCIHRPFEMNLKDGTKVRGVEYDMKGYMSNTDDRYCTMAQEIAGKPVYLNKPDTPFIVEDHKLSPAGKPVVDGLGIECPFWS